MRRIFWWSAETFISFLKDGVFTSPPLMILSISILSDSSIPSILNSILMVSFHVLHWMRAYLKISCIQRCCGVEINSFPLSLMQSYALNHIPFTVNCIALICSWFLINDCSLIILRPISKHLTIFHWYKHWRHCFVYPRLLGLLSLSGHNRRDLFLQWSPKDRHI